MEKLKELTDAAAKILQEEIDREILESMVGDMLDKKGWAKSPITKPWGPFNNWAAETAEWVHLHATGDYKLVLNHWYFENAADATAFTLKWA